MDSRSYAVVLGLELFPFLPVLSIIYAAKNLQT